VTDQPTPSSLDSERSVLGAILLDNERLRETETLSVEHFSLSSNRKIFRAMLDMDEENIPIDIITLSDTLRSKQELESIGGVSYLASLTDGVPPRANLTHYVRILAGMKQRRDLLMLCHKAMVLAYEPSSDMRKAIESLAGAGAENLN
jgi:replicative DNA helicase